MTEDCTLIGPRGFVLDRQQCLDRYRSGALKTEALKPRAHSTIVGLPIGRRETDG